MASAAAAVQPQGSSLSPEDAAIDEIVKISIEMERAQAKGKDGKVLRGAHAKHHGLVRAEFEVRHSLPPRLARGLFAKPQKFQAYIRFSNGSNNQGPDREGQARGMAIKLLGVPGAKVLESERHAQTHDFLLTDHPQFFVKDAFDYLAFLKTVQAGDPKKFFFPKWWNPNTWRRDEANILKEIRGKRVTNPLALTYWSGTPYLLGDETAVKYTVIPTIASPGEEPNLSNPDYLREALTKTLANQEMTFDFRVQIHADPYRQPIEDARVNWYPVETFTLATLTIPKQPVQSQTKLALAENLAFTPWHALPEHEPLGSLNRARGRVYQEIARYRRVTNGVGNVEPGPDGTM